MDPKLDLDFLEGIALERQKTDWDDAKQRFQREFGPAVVLKLTAAARELERIRGAFHFFATNVAAARRWDEVDTAEDLIHLATELGWDPKDGGK
jgi:hypothetical protein